MSTETLMKSEIVSAPHRLALRLFVSLAEHSWRQEEVQATASHFVVERKTPQKHISEPEMKVHEETLRERPPLRHGEENKHFVSNK